MGLGSLVKWLFSSSIVKGVVITSAVAGGGYATYEIVLAPTESKRIIVNPPNTYKVVLPFKEPKTVDERFVFKNNDVVTYMNWVRTKDNVVFANTLAHLFANPVNISNWKSIKDKLDNMTKLGEFTSIEDVPTREASRDIYEGTHVAATPIFYQEDRSGNLIPIKHTGVEGIVLMEEADVNVDSSTPEKYDIEVVGIRRLTHNNVLAYSVLWSPDGEKILFLGNSQIWTMDKDGKNQRTLTQQGKYYHPSWSPNGKKIVFVKEHEIENSEIYTMDVDGRNKKRLTKHRALDIFPYWSPDGSRIAFCSSRGRSDSSIYVMDTDGSNVTKVTNKPASYQYNLRWSPDGKNIAFETKISENNDIYIVDVDKGNIKQLTKNRSGSTAYSHSWSPDGSEILVTDGKTLYVIDVDGMNKRRLTSNRAYSSYHSWSPDCMKIAFVSKKGSREIYVVDADGSNEKRLTNNLAYDTHPIWSPDGEKILFVSNRDGNNDIYVMDLKLIKK